jgi:hypothetical protein
VPTCNPELTLLESTGSITKMHCVGCLIGKGAISEAAAWHDCSLGVIMKGTGAPAHRATLGPRAGPWLVGLA